MIWANIIATLAICLGFLVMLKHSQWKTGGMVVFLSLLIFLGQALNIDKFISANNSFNFNKQVLAISNDLQQVRAELRIQMSQTMVLTNIVNNFNDNSVRNVTEIRKEVADVKELITQLYSRTRTERISCSDTNKVTVYKSTNDTLIAAIRLEGYPIPASFSAMGVVKGSPAVPLSPDMFHFYGNVVAFTVGKVPNPNDLTLSFTYVLRPVQTNLITKVHLEANHLLIEGMDGENGVEIINFPE